MKARPILFSGEMIRALLDGRKTQTRRVVKPQPPKDCYDAAYWKPDPRISGSADPGFYYWDSNGLQRILCPFGQPGNLLWVRETWRQGFPKTSFSDGIIYRADKAKALGMQEYADHHKWKPSIHMKRKHSRLTLKITDVRVERVQDISEDDAIAEGVDAISIAAVPRQATWSRRGDFAQLWDTLNAKRSYGWDENPWVWVISFNVIQKNVDEVLSDD